jgi:hypothetical protein
MMRNQKINVEYIMNLLWFRELDAVCNRRYLLQYFKWSISLRAELSRRHFDFQILCI